MGKVVRKGFPEVVTGSYRVSSLHETVDVCLLYSWMAGVVQVRNSHHSWQEKTALKQSALGGG